MAGKVRLGETVVPTETVGGSDQERPATVLLGDHHTGRAPNGTGNGSGSATHDTATPPAPSRTESEPASASSAAVRLRGARLAFGKRTLWEGLDLEVAPGEFVAVLGPNGSGKTSLLRMLLGQLAPSAGAVEVAGSLARVGNPHIGYIPQQKTIDAGVQLRGVDLVGLGVDGHRWGLGFRGRKERRRKVADAVAQVGAEHYAHAPLESLSGGEQQRLRVAQALVGDPRVLLCDEPLLSLDLANQRLVSELIDARRRAHDTAVLFVTHEINPILPLVDRVLYLVDGKFRIGTPDEVMTSEVLSELYRTEVDVLRVRGRLVVVGTGDTMDALGVAGGHCHADEARA
nr:metal ABC transporter ATP-binding protein [Nocardia wallacei]